jgi:tryptophan synthase beta chain
VNEALRDYAANFQDTHYLIGSALGPHPYPTMVRDFQRVIGLEARRQILERESRLPDLLVACVGGGSNSIGLFHPFLNDRAGMVGVEAGGDGTRHAARLCGEGRVGVLHGMMSRLLEDDNGQVRETHSVSAGLDYPAVGPEHAMLSDKGRVRYVAVKDEDALRAFHTVARSEGIIPALESSHALAYAMEAAGRMERDGIIIVCVSGRGDKDVDHVRRLEGEKP